MTLVLRWLAGLIGAAIVFGGPIVWAYIVAMACAFGSVNGNCQLSDGFFNSEALVAFWLPWLFGICMLVFAVRWPRLPARWRGGVAISLPVLFLVAGWAGTRHPGFWSREPAGVEFGLESYYDHPVVVTDVRLNGQSIGPYRPHPVRSSGDRDGPRWGASQAISWSWPLARSRAFTVDVDWTDLRSRQAWTAALNGDLDQVDVRDRGGRPRAFLGLVLGPNGAAVLASDRAPFTEEWNLTPVDVDTACGVRKPDRDKDWMQEPSLISERMERYFAPAPPYLAPQPAARLPQPAHACAPPS